MLTVTLKSVTTNKFEEHFCRPACDRGNVFLNSFKAKIEKKLKKKNFSCVQVKKNLPKMGAYKMFLKILILNYIFDGCSLM